jgi:outer membrane protein OmpA-like peptidoglycan-associated protein
MSTFRKRLFAATAVLAMGAGVSVALAQGAAPAAPAAPAAAPPAAPPPLVPLAFSDAVLKAATDLFAKANVPAGTDKLAVVIDPLVDGVSGAQTVATREIGKRLEAYLKAKEPRFEVKPFNTESVAKQPYLLVGTFTAINAATNQPAGPRDVYRFCLAMADLKSGKIVAKGVARAKPEGINANPAMAFDEQAMWVKDPTVDGYVKTCQATKLGDSIDPAYLANISSAAAISDAILAYEHGRYGDALKFYQTVSSRPGGEQLRVLNGIYLANWKLNKKKEAAEAFGKLIDYGMKSDKLAMKFLFQPGSTGFIRNGRISAPYPLWLQQIGQRADAANSCLEVVGHTSSTGLAPLNLRLSAARAEYVVERIAAATPKMRSKMISSGVGSKEMLIGTGKDNASDALDRRVEFKVIKCGSTA